MHEDEECFEQCIDCASNPSPISTNNGGTSVQLHLSKSVDNGLAAISLPLKKSCKSHLPLLQQCRSFSCGDKTSMSTVKNEIPNLDSKIWQTFSCAYIITSSSMVRMNIIPIALMCQSWVVESISQTRLLQIRY